MINNDFFSIAEWYPYTVICSRRLTFACKRGSRTFLLLNSKEKIGDAM